MIPYGQDRTTAQEVSTSLITDAGHLTERLREIHDRIVKIGDALHGSAPRDASAKPNAPEPTPNVRRNLDNAAHMVAMIDSELSRVESRI